MHRFYGDILESFRMISLKKKIFINWKWSSMNFAVIKHYLENVCTVQLAPTDKFYYCLQTHNSTRLNHPFSDKAQVPIAPNIFNIYIFEKLWMLNTVTALTKSLLFFQEKLCPDGMIIKKVWMIFTAWRLNSVCPLCAEENIFLFFITQGE